MKKKISFNELLDAITLFVINSWKENQKLYVRFLKDAGEDEAIDNHKKTELLIFEMLAMTIAVRKTLNSELLLDSFHNAISEKVSEFEGTKEHFKELLIERYAIYQKILGEGGSFLVFGLGKQFADYFLNKDFQGMALINYSGEMFLEAVKQWSEFLESVISEYEIGKF